jgi:hypothetical protein
MHAMHGYTITFAAVPAKRFDGEDVYRSRYTITGPGNDQVESILGSVEHFTKDGALDQAQMMGQRRLSSLALHGVHHIYHQSWSAS